MNTGKSLSLGNKNKSQSFWLLQFYRTQILHYCILPLHCRVLLHRFLIYNICAWSGWHSFKIKKKTMLLNILSKIKANREYNRWITDMGCECVVSKWEWQYCYRASIFGNIFKWKMILVTIWQNTVKIWTVRPTQLLNA